MQSMQEGDELVENKTVTFTGENLRAQVAQAFGFDREDEEEVDEAAAEEFVVAEAASHRRLGIGAIADSEDAKKQGDGGKEGRLEKLAKRKRTLPATAPLKPELRTWESDDDGDGDVLAMKGSKRVRKNELVKPILEELEPVAIDKDEGTAPPTSTNKKKKKSRKRGKKKSNDTKEVVSPIPPTIEPRSADTTENETEESRREPSNESLPQRRQKPKKKRSRRKNLRKDTRPPGTWLKTLGKIKQ